MKEVIHSTCNLHLLKLAVYDDCTYLYLVRISIEHESNGQL